jgi:hypothetical protein
MEVNFHASLYISVYEHNIVKSSLPPHPPPKKSIVSDLKGVGEVKVRTEIRCLRTDFGRGGSERTRKGWEVFGLS